MLGHLRNKTRILVTHAIDFLGLVDRVIVMNEGEIVLDGHYDAIKENPYLIKLMEIHKAHQNEQQEIAEEEKDVEKDTLKVEMNMPDNEDDDQELID